MHTHSKITSRQPFRARLKYYHRTATPAHYSRKRKRWEDSSLADLAENAHKPNPKRTPAGTTGKEMP